MNVVIVSEVLNIHQVALADALYSFLGSNFKFIETNSVNSETDLKGGCKIFDREYLLRPSFNPSVYNFTLKIIREADVMIYDGAPLQYLKERIKTDKLTFIHSERWLKKGIFNLLSPRLLKQQLFYHLYCRQKPFYALCASAYAAQDFALMQSFKDKCFKWGYFPAVPNLNVEALFSLKKCDKKIKILWVARFIAWKHPEKMIELALKLRESHIDFCINMIGTGKLQERITLQIEKYKLEGNINILGGLPNDEVLGLMKSHHIFCMTSDKNEGWGAVLNEAMSYGCCPVASIEAGATPFLVKDGINGLTFKLSNQNDLYRKVYWLINNPDIREKMGYAAYDTIHNEWSPQNAALKLIELSNCLLTGEEINIYKDGVCSKIEI